MFNWLKEGQEITKDGFYFYPLDCTHSVGFMLVLKNRRLAYRFRYSKVVKKFFFQKIVPTYPVPDWAK